MLLAWDKGIGYVLENTWFLDNPKFREELGVKPGERIISMLQFGYFDEIPKPRHVNRLKKLLRITDRKAKKNKIMDS